MEILTEQTNETVAQKMDEKIIIITPKTDKIPWHVRNKEKHAENCRRWRQANKDKHKDYCENWKRANKDKYNEFHKINQMKYDEKQRVKKKEAKLLKQSQVQ